MSIKFINDNMYRGNVKVQLPSGHFEDLVSRVQEHVDLSRAHNSSGVVYRGALPEMNIHLIRRDGDVHLEFEPISAEAYVRLGKAVAEMKIMQRDYQSSLLPE